MRKNFKIEQLQGLYPPSWLYRAPAVVLPDGTLSFRTGWQHVVSVLLWQICEAPKMIFEKLCMCVLAFF